MKPCDSTIIIELFFRSSQELRNRHLVGNTIIKIYNLIKSGLQRCLSDPSVQGISRTRGSIPGTQQPTDNIKQSSQFCFKSYTPAAKADDVHQRMFQQGLNSKEKLYNCESSS